jgi:hypothetical protein
LAETHASVGNVREAQAERQQAEKLSQTVGAP